MVAFTLYCISLQQILIHSNISNTFPKIKSTSSVHLAPRNPEAEVREMYWRPEKAIKTNAAKCCFSSFAVSPLVFTEKNARTHTHTYTHIHTYTHSYTHTEHFSKWGKKKPEKNKEHSHRLVHRLTQHKRRRRRKQRDNGIEPQAICQRNVAAVSPVRRRKRSEPGQRICP